MAALNLAAAGQRPDPVSLELNRPDSVF